MPQKTKREILKNEKIKRIRNDIINLLLDHKYIKESKVQNKILYLYQHQFITTNRANKLMLGINAITDFVGRDDIISDIDLAIVEIYSNYKPVRGKSRRKCYKGKTVSPAGYILKMIPYYVKKFMDQYEKVYDVKCNIENEEVQLTSEIYEEVDDIDDVLEFYNGMTKTKDDMVISNLSDSILFQKDEIGITFNDQANEFMINPASLRRRMSK